jgi:predicted O-methyltransferase YrrM
MQFTTNWFDPHMSAWNSIVPSYKPSTYLEIGSFEGRSTCHLIGMMGDTGAMDVHCIDTWQGGEEHSDINMGDVERRFDDNIQSCVNKAAHPVNVRKLKGTSLVGLAHLIAEGKTNYFDMAYIDGSHQTPDVLADCLLTFPLVKVGGLIVFDDYVWGLGANSDPLMSPKLAIDSFMNCYQRKLQAHPWLPLCQLYCRKLSN